MRTHQALQKKATTHKAIAPTSNPLASRPFALQPKAEETERSALLPRGDAKGERSSATLSPESRKYQSTLGNFAILNPEGGRSMPVQPKLAIGQVGDKYEQEADQVAQQVVQRLNAPPSVQSNQQQTLQRQEMPQEEEGLQMKPEFTLQRQTNPGEEDELQMKPMLQLQGGQGDMAATPELESSIQGLRGSGQPLADTVREPMERAFGADFSRVKVHTDAQSDRLNQSIQAKAFTTGQDIFFRQGAYEPGNTSGQELIAHELTHVVQQNGGAVQQGRAQIHRAENPVIQPWRDENGKFYMGVKPPNADTDWEQFTTPQGEIRWRPKPGSTAAKEVEEAKKAKAAEAEASKTEKDYDAVFLMDAAKIRFSQDSISAYFKDGNSVESLANSLKSGSVTADEVQPILLVERQKKLITLDNRRLWAFKEAGKEVRCRWATPDEIKANAFKFTAGKLGKTTITVRK
jgi:hypothetical protein